MRSTVARRRSALLAEPPNEFFPSAALADSTRWSPSRRRLGGPQRSGCCPSTSHAEFTVSATSLTVRCLAKFRIGRPLLMVLLSFRVARPALPHPDRVNDRSSSPATHAHDPKLRLPDSDSGRWD
jgi:hypothetical protein